jgi:glutamine synthetase
MKDLDIELWKMGITSKTKHNEVAPAQFEMAPIYATTNIGTDHNQLVMETMKKVALRHDLVCLLHEKPYAGSTARASTTTGPWAPMTDSTCWNRPHPQKNQIFLLMLAALVKSVDIHADILRASAATAQRPPARRQRSPAGHHPIFMGSEITELLTKIAKSEKYEGKDRSFVKVGVDTLPALPKDNSDRNRTSPFAFTRNKFESAWSAPQLPLPDPMLS